MCHKYAMSIYHCLSCTMAYQLQYFCCQYYKSSLHDTKLQLVVGLQFGNTTIFGKLEYLYPSLTGSHRPTMMTPDKTPARIKVAWKGQTELFNHVMQSEQVRYGKMMGMWKIFLYSANLYS